MTEDLFLKTPRFTIITSTFNCAEDLEKTAQSIREQAYKNIQWIIADGASKDETVSVIHRNSDIVSNWFSEPDNGIYDAWNKASHLIDGDWVLFLGAGDLLFEEKTLEDISRKIISVDSQVLIAYGDVVLYKKGSVELISAEVDLKSWQLYRPSLPHHQGVMQHASVFKKIKFDTDYKIVADSKFILQSLEIGSIVYLSQKVSRMELQGVSNHPRYVLAVRKEFRKLERELGYSVPLFNKSIYFILVYFKYYIYKFLGAEVADGITRIKRALFRSNNQ